MRTHTNEEREKQYNKLPEVLQEALYSPDLANTIFDLGKKYGLTIEQIGFLAEEAGTLVLGLTRPPEFASIIQERLRLDLNKTNDIAREVNNKIFFPLREALKATHQIDIQENWPATTISPIPPTPQAPIRSLSSPEPKIAPEPKKEITSIVSTPTPQPQPQKPSVPPVDLRPSPVLPESPSETPVRPSGGDTPLAKKFFNKFAAPKQEVRGLKQELRGAAMPKPAEPLNPSAPPAQPKIPPIDLRRSRSERMREAIFAPPIEPEEKPKETLAQNKMIEPQKPPDSSAPPATEKKAPYGGYDPYKEPTE